MKNHSEIALVEDKPVAMPGLDSEWFKLRMRRNHLTTRGLGERVGLHYSAIGRMTNGLHGLGADDAAMFAKAFGGLIILSSVGTLALERQCCQVTGGHSGLFWVCCVAKRRTEQAEWRQHCV